MNRARAGPPWLSAGALSLRRAPWCTICRGCGGDDHIPRAYRGGLARHRDYRCGHQYRRRRDCIHGWASQPDVGAVMIIKTRYRDIPYEEIGHPMNHPELWKSLRGTPITIIRGPEENVLDRNPLCDEPRWLTNTRGDNGIRWVVCPHIAEIGD